MTQLIGFDTLGTLLRVDPEYYGQQAIVIADTLGYSGEVETLRAAVRKVRTKLEHEVAASGRHYGVGMWLARIAQELELPLPRSYEVSNGRKALALLQARLPLHPVERELPATLRSLKRQGVRIAHVCNTGLILGSSVRAALARSDLSAVMDVSLFSEELGYAVPDQRVYQSLMRSLGVAPSDVLYVGGDVDGAAQAGFQVVRYRPQRNTGTDGDVIQSHTELLDKV